MPVCASSRTQPTEGMRAQASRVHYRCAASWRRCLSPLPVTLMGARWSKGWWPRELRWLRSTPRAATSGPPTTRPPPLGSPPGHKRCPARGSGGDLTVGRRTVKTWLTPLDDCACGAIKRVDAPRCQACKGRWVRDANALVTAREEFRRQYGRDPPPNRLAFRPECEGSGGVAISSNGPSSFRRLVLVSRGLSNRAPPSRPARGYPVGMAAVDDGAVDSVDTWFNTGSAKPHCAWLCCRHGNGRRRRGRQRRHTVQRGGPHDGCDVQPG